MAKIGNGWAPRPKRIKKTSIGNGKGTKHKSKGSNGTTPKGYKKKYRGQGK
jgi:hypothetical protein